MKCIQTEERIAIPLALPKSIYGLFPLAFFAVLA